MQQIINILWKQQKNRIQILHISLSKLMTCSSLHISNTAHESTSFNTGGMITEVQSVALSILCRMFSRQSSILQMQSGNTLLTSHTLILSHSGEAVISYQIYSWWSLQTRPPPARRSSPRGAHPPPSIPEHRLYKSDFLGWVNIGRG